MKIITRKYLLIFCLNYIRNKRKGLPDNGNRRGAAPLEDNEKEPCFLRHGSVCRKSSPAAIFSDRLAPSAYSLANIGVLCAAAHSPCICSHLRVALGLWPNSPQGWRFPSVPTASPGGGRRNLATQGFRIHRTCRWIRISLGGPAGPPNLSKSSFDSLSRAF